MTLMKKFKVENILEWQPKIQVSPSDIPLYLIKSKKKYPFIGQSSKNNAVVGFLSLDEKLLNNKECEPCIIASSNTQEFSFIDTPFYLKEAGGSMSYMKNSKLNIYNSLYLITAIKKELKYKYSYTVKATNSRIKETIIQLPVKSMNDEEPDWDCMEGFIRETMPKYLNKLDSEKNSLISKIKNKRDDIIKLLGLEDVELSNSDSDFLKASKAMKLFRIGDILKTQRGNRLISSYRIEGKIPFVTAGENNRGISSYIDKSNKVVWSHSPSISVDMFGHAFVHEYCYGYDDHVVEVYREGLTINQLQYLATTIQKELLLSGKYSWMIMVTKPKLDEEFIKLPTVSQISEEPDWNYMDTYIGIVTKKAILKYNAEMEAYRAEMEAHKTDISDIINRLLDDNIVNSILNKRCDSSS